MSKKRNNHNNHGQNSEIETEHSSPKEVSLQTIGHFLREGRKKRGHTLHDLSELTRINITQLEMLENDQLDKLPSKAYVTGFVKAYVRYLNLDKELALKQLNDTYVELFPNKFPIHKDLSPGDESSSKFMVVILVVLGISAIGYFGFNFLKTKSQNEIRTELKNPIQPQVLDSEAPLKEEITEVENANTTPIIVETPKINEVEARPEVKPVVVEVKPEVKEVIPEKKKEEVKEEKKKVEDEVSFYSIGKNLFSFDEENPKTMELLPGSIKNSMIEGKQNVFVLASEGATWITYKKDHGPIRKFVLEKGKSLFLSGDVIRMFLGNVNATKIFLNNKPINTDSKSGIKSLIFPLEVQKDFKLPLFIFQKTGEVITAEEYLEQKSKKD